MKERPTIALLLIVLMCAGAYGQPSARTADPFPTYSPYILDFRENRSPLGYNYAPTGIHLGDKRWVVTCGSEKALTPLGDNIMSALIHGLSIEGSSMTQPTPVFGPLVWSRQRSDWKRLRTFDRDGACGGWPIRIGSYWYLYYEGMNASATLPTSIGVARSHDGVNWETLYGSDWQTARGPKPLLYSTLRTTDRTTGCSMATRDRYGSGHPAVILIPPYIYLFYTDSEGCRTEGNGAGIYVIRSTDPTFQRNVERLSGSGFRAVYGDLNSAANHRLRTGYALRYVYPDGVRTMQVNVPEVQYSDMWQAFLVLNTTTHATHSAVQITVFPALNKAATETLEVEMPPAAYWQDSIGAVRTPEGHSLWSSTCGYVPLEILGNWINPELLALSQQWAASGQVNAATFASRLAGATTLLRSVQPCP